MSTDRARLSPDERYEAAALAAGRQRRNQPRGLVVLGGVLFLGACLALAGAWAARSGAEGVLSGERERTLEVQRLSAELEAYRQARLLDPTSAQLYEPDPNFRSKVSDFARRAGLVNVPPVPAQSNRPVQGGRRVDWPYALTEPDLAPVVEWVRLILSEIPGTFVTSIEIRPQGNNWRVQVTISYYEKL